MDVCYLKKLPGKADTTFQPPPSMPFSSTPTINNSPLPCSELMSFLSLVCHKLGWSDLYSF